MRKASNTVDITKSSFRKKTINFIELGGDGAVDKTHASGVKDCETPMCPWARHLTPSCSIGVRLLTYAAIVSRFG